MTEHRSRRVNTDAPLLLQPPTRSPCRQRDMLQALDGLQMRKQLLDILRSASNGNDFEAVVVIEVDVLRR